MSYLNCEGPGSQHLPYVTLQIYPLPHGGSSGQKYHILVKCFADNGRSSKHSLRYIMTGKQLDYNKHV